MHHHRWLLLALVSSVFVTLGRGVGIPTPPATTRSVQATFAVPNDNRTPAGTLRNGVLELDLEARPARWEGEVSDLDPGVAPLIEPGASFTVRINPPRAGTFIYHTHMDETDQLVQGMIGPILVLEPGQEYDAEHERVFVIGGQVEGNYPVTINGDREPPPMSFRVGETYRLRFVHITMGENPPGRRESTSLQLQVAPVIRAVFPLVVGQPHRVATGHRNRP